MRKAGILTLVISLVVSGFLLLVWLVGFGFGVAGSLIHLLLVMALPIGIGGATVGVALLVVNAFRTKSGDGQPPPPPSSPSTGH